MGCAWGSMGRGGYESEFEQMTFKNVGQIASWYHKYSWIMVDIVSGNNAAHLAWRVALSHGPQTLPCSALNELLCSKPLRSRRTGR